MLLNLFHGLWPGIFGGIACFFLGYLGRGLQGLGFLGLTLLFAGVLCRCRARVPLGRRCRFLIRVLFSLLGIRNILFFLGIRCTFTDIWLLGLLEFCRFLTWSTLFALSCLLCFVLFIVKNCFCRHRFLQLDLMIMMRKIL